MIGDAALQDRIRSRFSFLRQASTDFERGFFLCATHARLESGQFVCREGSQCAYLALLLSGSARVYKLGESGREITLYRIEPGQSCILTASCILSDLPFPAFAVAETPVEAVVVPPGEVRQWILESPPWRSYVFGLIATRLGEVISVVEEVAFHRMDRRLAAYLLQGRLGGDGATLRTTHHEIAADLGTSREVVSRILKDFERSRLIETARGSIRLLNRTALQAKTSE